MAGLFWGFLFFSLVSLTAGAVKVLTTENFDSFIAENELVLVEFYAPWCGHCKRLEPEFEKASEELDGTGSVLGKVDATIEKELGERFKVEGYPTLKLFRSGTSSPYEGGRSAQDIVTFMKKQAGPAITPLASADEVEAFIPNAEDEDAVVIGFVEADSKQAKFIADFASKFRDDFRFGLVTSTAAAGTNAMGSIVLFKPFDEKKNVYSGDLTEEDLATFLKGNAMRAVAEIGPGNYGAYVKRGLPISWLFIDPADTKATEAVLAEYRKVAPDFKQKASLVYLNGVQYKQMATKMGLTGDKYPGLAIENDSEHFVFSETDELSEETMRPWFTKWAAGELAPTVKSEPIPASLFDEHNVAVVVGENFKEVVLDDTKDVLIEFYAPWCGHCKSLIPTWNQLGSAFKGVPSIVIAKTDATANDYPAGFQVTGFPSIQLVQSKGNNVVKYKGDRSFDAFVAWLKQNAATPFEIADKGTQQAAEEEDKDEL